MVLEGLLKPLGYVITPAMDGNEALEMIRSRRYLPDLVLLDVQMPNKTGFEVRTRMFMFTDQYIFLIIQIYGLIGLRRIEKRLS